MFNDDPDLLKKVITGDESWVYEYDKKDGKKHIKFSQMWRFCRNQASTIVFMLTFSLPKTKDTDEKKEFCYDWKDKRNIETAAIDDTRKRISEVYYIWGDYFEGDKIVIRIDK